MDGIDNIIKSFIKYGGIYPFNKSDGFDLADVNRMKSEGIIEHKNKTTWQLTKKGWEIYESGKSWREWEGITQVHNVHIGNNISNSTVSHSNLSTNALNSPISTYTNTKDKQSVMVRVLKFISENIVKIIIGVIISLVSLYLGFNQ